MVTSIEAGVDLVGAGRDRLFIVSADGHAGPRTATYKDYLEREHLPAFEEFLAGHQEIWTPERPESVLAERVRDWQRDNPRYQEGGMDSLWDPARRLRELDADGIALEVLFPDDQNENSQPWLAGLPPLGLARLPKPYPPDLQLVGARAYNRWLAEYCAHDPSRLVGAIILGNLHDVDAAVAEIHRAHESGLRHVVCLPLVYYEPLYHHPRYDPLWQACVDLDLTVAVHLADGGPHWYGDDGWGAPIYVIEAMWFAQRPLWCMVYGRVFERFPELRVVFTEIGAMWVPELLGRLDGMALGGFLRPAIEDPLPLRPSEYFRRQCFVANSLLNRAEVDARHRIGVESMVFGSDYLHHEGMWPDTVARMRALFDGVPDDEARAILGGNFLRAYHVDEASLGPVADRIGLAPDALGLAAPAPA